MYVRLIQKIHLMPALKRYQLYWEQKDFFVSY